VHIEKYRDMPFNYKVARFSILLRHVYPFLGELCMRVKKHRKTSEGLAETDGYHIYFNEEAMNAIPEEQFNFVMVHEILHIVLRHSYPDEMPFWQREYYNIAADLVINDLILHEMQSKLKWGGLPVIPVEGSAVSPDCLAEDPSNRITKAFLEQAIAQGVTGAEPPIVVELVWKNFITQILNHSYIMDIITGHGGEEDKSQKESEAKELLEACQKTAGCDGLPNSLLEKLEAITSRKLPWQVILRRYIEAIKGMDEQGFCPPDKRTIYSGMILPGENEEDKGLNNAIVVVDVSSSVGRDELSAQLWQVGRLLAELQFDGEILSFSGAVEKKGLLTDKKSLEAWVDGLPVGGGTSWLSVVNYVEKERKGARPIIVFTDGYFYSFETTLKNVILIVQGEYPEELADVGKVIRVN
jgi:predicted metal-dependent peptidase